MQANPPPRLGQQLEDPVVSIIFSQNPPASAADVFNVLNGIKCDLCDGKGHSSFSCVNQSIQSWALHRIVARRQ